MSGKLYPVGIQNFESLRKDVERFENVGLQIAKKALKNNCRTVRDICYISQVVNMSPAKAKDLAFQLKGECPNLILVLGGVFNGKPYLTVMINENLVKEYDLHAGQIVKDAAQEMKGGGGGQPFFATAGGSNPDGVEKAIARAEKLIGLKIQAELV